MFTTVEMLAGQPFLAGLTEHQLSLRAGHSQARCGPRLVLAVPAVPLALRRRLQDCQRAAGHHRDL
jgi:hypothetical protein